MSFGERLKLLRKEKGLTQEKLGELLTLSKANISKYESDDLQPSMESLRFLSDYFNVSGDYLLGKTDYPNPVLIADTKEELMQKVAEQRLTNNKDKAIAIIGIGLEKGYNLDDILNLLKALPPRTTTPDK